MANPSLRKFCFTLNNWTQEEYDSIVSWVTTRSVFTVIGKEHIEEGTPHLQGFVHMKTPVKFSTVKKAIPRAHIEKARGTDADNLAYCSKEHDFWTMGEPQGQGERSDLDGFKEAVRAGMTHEQVLESFSEVCAKYPQFVREYEDTRANAACPHTVIEHPYDWQRDLVRRVQDPADDRKIIWVYDEVGGHGKTTLARHLVDNFGAFYTNGGRGIDIAYAYQRQRIVVFDYVREAREFLNYGIIEALKNGILTSSKYASCVKRFAPPHVIVFANFLPESNKFSADRIELISI